MNDLILITGGTGAMGSVLIPRLAARGYAIRVLTLAGDPNAARLRNAGVDVRFGDVSRSETLVALCEGVSVVLHLAAIILTNDESLYTSVNAGGTRNMLEAARAAGVSHFIHVSSASVVYPKPTPYSISKRLAESFVRQSGVPWTIVRPTLVCGKQGGQELDMFLDYLKKFPVIPFIGKGSAVKRPVHVDDIVEGLLTLACRKTGSNVVYNFSGATAISILDFAKLCNALMGRPGKPIIRLPVWLCAIIAFVMKLVMKDPPLKWSVIAGMTQDADLDPREAMAGCGYCPIGVETFLPGCFPRVK
jgi:NADH dehydrogenase